ncbi:diacylglycerol kinase [Carnobacterium sp. 17-4]|uniref:diacylglycerol/lipid kinase family protein n=1 Tax=Carnobacterium sp. (strain 17-4) TaxID=208596 RepID=UPI00020586C4|nr:diacylglycerol kinase family protein [Carnobacterium sp. 17-4]AEB29338.1 diacylglycerol kinase [Carnobacterium sp. 17-4]
MKKAVLIVNPSSGGEKGSEYSKLALETLERLYDEVVLKETTKGGDAEAFAKSAAKERVEAIFVMGGDGTVNESISGLAEEEYRPKLGIIPLGTVNDLGRALGIPLDPATAIRMLPDAITKKLDIGKVNDTYFVDVIAIGKIPEAVKNVGADQKTRLGSLAYFIEGAKALSDGQSYTFKLELDDEVYEQESSLVLIALTNSVGGFENMLPHAKIDDGYLHLIVLKGKTLMDKLKLVPKIVSGNASDANETLYKKFKSGKVSVSEEDNQVMSNIDGDEGDKLPLNVQVLPSHITIFVPKDTKEE